MSAEVARSGMRDWTLSCIPYLDVCCCRGLQILAVAVRRIGDIYFPYLMSAAAVIYRSWQLLCAGLWGLPAHPHQHLSSNTLGASAPDEAYSRPVRASGTLKPVEHSPPPRTHSSILTHSRREEHGMLVIGIHKQG